MCLAENPLSWGTCHLVQGRGQVPEQVGALGQLGLHIGFASEGFFLSCLTWFLLTWRGGGGGSSSDRQTCRGKCSLVTVAQIQLSDFLPGFSAIELVPKLCADLSQISCSLPLSPVHFLLSLRVVACTAPVHGDAQW